MDKKILLVEDDDLIRKLYKRQFDKAGFVTDAFANGKDGLQAGLSNNYDLILLDILLPGINGIEILKQLRQNEKTKTAVIIMLTNLGQETIIKEAFLIGADGYLIKASFTPSQIVEEVREIVNLKKATLVVTNPASSSIRSDTSAL